MKYFEPRHMLTATDVAHGCIEKQMRKEKKQTNYDFKDIVHTIKQAKCNKVHVLEKL